jgi:hypothetical protein
VEVLHGDPVGVVVLAEIEDLRDVRVVDARGDAGLVEEHVDELVVLDEVRVDALDRDPLLEAAGPVHAREVHARHAADADLVDDAVATEEEGPRQPCPPCPRPGRHGWRHRVRHRRPPGQRDHRVPPHCGQRGGEAERPSRSSLAPTRLAFSTDLASERGASAKPTRSAKPTEATRLSEPPGRRASTTRVSSGKRLRRLGRAGNRSGRCPSAGSGWGSFRRRLPLGTISRGSPTVTSNSPSISFSAASFSFGSPLKSSWKVTVPSVAYSTTF